jgi:hypothetical protein
MCFRSDQQTQAAGRDASEASGPGRAEEVKSRNRLLPRGMKLQNRARRLEVLHPLDAQPDPHTTAAFHPERDGLRPQIDTEPGFRAGSAH